MPQQTIPESAHKVISERAAIIANQMAQKAIPELGRHKTDIFDSFSGLEGTQISLRFKFSVDADQEMKAKLREIAVRAVKKSVVENKEVFASAIADDMRNGKNYFDRWGTQ